MEVAIAILGSLIGILGVAGIAAPGAMSRAIGSFKSSPGRIYGWAAVRVLVGALLILGASDTAFPTLIRVIGAVLVLKAVLVPLMGLDRARSLLEWLQARPPPLIRMLFIPVVAFGVFLLWAALQ